MTLPALMQEVQELKRFGVPLITARTVWMFGFQRRFVRRWECEMLLPKPGPLPQTSQTEATGSLHWVLVRWVVVPDAAGTVVEGYPTDAGSREPGRSAAGPAAAVTGFSAARG